MSLVKFSNSRYPHRYNRMYNEDLLNDFFNWNSRPALQSRSNSPSVNIKEDEQGFTLELASPGLDKKDLKIELNNDILTISSDKKEEKEEKKENFSRREFYQQSFSRSFTLPNTVKSEDIKAQYENGILEVSIPKKEEAKPKPKVEIAIS